MEDFARELLLTKPALSQERRIAAYSLRTFSFAPRTLAYIAYIRLCGFRAFPHLLPIRRVHCVQPARGLFSRVHSRTLACLKSFAYIRVHSRTFAYLQFPSIYTNHETSYCLQEAGDFWVKKYMHTLQDTSLFQQSPQRTDIHIYIYIYVYIYI